MHRLLILTVVALLAAQPFAERGDRRVDRRLHLQVEMTTVMLQRPRAALLAGALIGAIVMGPGMARAQAVPGATLAIDAGTASPEMLRMVAARDDWPVDRRL